MHQNPGKTDRLRNITFHISKFMTNTNIELFIGSFCMKWIRYRNYIESFFQLKYFIKSRGIMKRDKESIYDIKKQRNNACINGALISIGLLAVLDNIISHWLLKLHRVLPDHTLSGYIEILVFMLGVIMLTVGIYREAKERKLINS